MRATQLTDPVTFHGEGAVWDAGWGGLKFVDMLAGDVLSLDPSGSGAVSRLATGSPVAALVRPRASGGFVVAAERSFQLWDSEGRFEWASDALIPEGLRFNEGGCDPEGRLLCASLAYDFAPGAGSMLRLDVDRSVTTLFDGLAISNGLGFTSDGSRMFYTDTPTRRIDVFDVTEGELSGRRPFVHIAEGAGNPDGLTVDAAGGIWVALYGGSAVHHYEADGTLTEVVELPVSRVTSCTLGGADLTTLYITTSREGLEPGDEPEAGALFTADVGTVGLPRLAFAG